MFRALSGAPGGKASLALLIVMGLAALMAPIFWGRSAGQMDVLNAYQHPNPQHLLGTDPLGRDILLRILVGARTSVGLALAATVLAVVLGFSLGAIAVVLGGSAQRIILRTVDAVIAFPALLIAIFVGAIVGPGALGVIVGVGVANAFAKARLASSVALAVVGYEYFAASRVIGVSAGRRFLRYVLPNIAEPLIINTSVTVSSSLVAISGLSFLGLGVQSPDFDWGSMLTDGVNAFYVTPLAALAPAAAISVTALCFGLAGEALARAVNPLLATRSEDARVARNDDAAARVVIGVSGSVPGSLHGNRTFASSSLGSEPLLEVTDLTITFPGAAGPVSVVDGVSFTLAPGEVLGIVGESGSGKTMTAMAVAQLVPYPGTVLGTIRLRGRDLRELSAGQLDSVLAREMAVVFQDPSSSLNPAVTIGTQIVEAAEVHGGRSHREAWKLALMRLREVNMPAPELQMRRYPHQLSGGMRQRVLIAMGLMNEPALLIADEPTTMLDVTIQAQIIDLLASVHTGRHAAIIFISHNLALVQQMCQRVLVMYAGRVVEELRSEDLLKTPAHPYTRALLSAVPDIRQPIGETLVSIRGQLPDTSSRPSGCAFHPRCPLVIERCRVERPSLESGARAGRVACWVANAAPTE